MFNMTLLYRMQPKYYVTLSHKRAKEEKYLHSGYIRAGVSARCKGIWANRMRV